MPFLYIILILEDALSLVVIYAPFLLPSTCKLPSQQRWIDSLADQKRAKALLFANDALSTTAQRFSLCYMARTSRSWWPEQWQGTSVHWLECLHFPSSSLQGAGPSQHQSNTSLSPAAFSTLPHKMLKYPKTFIMTFAY